MRRICLIVGLLFYVSSFAYTEDEQEILNSCQGEYSGTEQECIIEVQSYRESLKNISKEIQKTKPLSSKEYTPFELDTLHNCQGAYGGTEQECKAEVESYRAKAKAILKNIDKVAKAANKEFGDISDPDFNDDINGDVQKKLRVCSTEKTGTYKDIIPMLKKIDKIFIDSFDADAFDGIDGYNKKKILLKLRALLPDSPKLSWMVNFIKRKLLNKMISNVVSYPPSMVYQRVRGIYCGHIIEGEFEKGRSKEDVKDDLYKAFNHLNIPRNYPNPNRPQKSGT